jgi:chemotaxis protein MotB
MRRKKNHGGGHENHERWLLTYADMITLLVAFFIMLYAMSVMSKQKFEQLALSVRSGFDGNQHMQAVELSPGTGIMQSNEMIAPEHITLIRRPTPDTSAADAQKAQEEEEMQNLKAKIDAVANKQGIATAMQVTETSRGLDIRILADRLLFNKGQGALRPDAGPLLTKIAQVLNSVPNDIAVEGHTDDLPISTPEYPSNWELSTSRATNVLRFMVEQGGVSADRVCAAGYADTRPVVPNTGEDNRMKNRRVDIVILRSSTDNSDTPSSEIPVS